MAKAASIRMMLFQLAQVYKLHIHVMDVDTVFLYAPLKKSTYMKTSGHYTKINDSKKASVVVEGIAFLLLLLRWKI